MICPTCRLELGIERRADELVATYDLEAFRLQCACRELGDPLLCGNSLPTVLKLLESNIGPTMRPPNSAKPWPKTVPRLALR
jgi:hypothetical protein